MMGQKIEFLPAEVVLQILRHVPSPDLIHVAQTNKSMAALALDDSLWRAPRKKVEQSQPAAFAALQKVRCRPRNFEKKLYEEERVINEGRRFAGSRPLNQYSPASAEFVALGVGSVFIGMIFALRGLGAPEIGAALGACAILVSAGFAYKNYTAKQKALLDRHAAEKRSGPVPHSLYAARACQASTVTMIQKTLDNALLHSIGYDFNFERTMVEELQAYDDSGVFMRAVDAQFLLHRVMDATSEWKNVRAVLVRYGAQA
jgi:hypothetical protein